MTVPEVMAGREAPECAPNSPHSHDSVLIRAMLTPIQIDETGPYSGLNGRTIDRPAGQSNEMALMLDFDHRGKLTIGGLVAKLYIRVMVSLFDLNWSFRRTSAAASGGIE
jgi:hypothetical protein